MKTVVYSVQKLGRFDNKMAQYEMQHTYII